MSPFLARANGAVLTLATVAKLVGEKHARRIEQLAIELYMTVWAPLGRWGLIWLG